MKKFLLCLLLLSTNTLLAKDTLVAISDVIDIPKINSVTFDPVGSYRALKLLQNDQVDAALVYDIEPIQKLLHTHGFQKKVIARQELYLAVAPSLNIDSIELEDLAKIFGPETVFQWKRLNHDYPVEDNNSGIVLPAADFSGFPLAREIFRSKVLHQENYNNWVEFDSPPGQLEKRIAAAEPIIAVFAQKPATPLKLIRVTHNGHNHDLGCNIYLVTKKESQGLDLEALERIKEHFLEKNHSRA